MRMDLAMCPSEISPLCGYASPMLHPCVMPLRYTPAASPCTEALYQARIPAMPPTPISTLPLHRPSLPAVHAVQCLHASLDPTPARIRACSYGTHHPHLSPLVLPLLTMLYLSPCPFPNPYPYPCLICRVFSVLTSLRGPCVRPCTPALSLCSSLCPSICPSLCPGPCPGSSCRRHPSSSSNYNPGCWCRERCRGDSIEAGRALAISLDPSCGELNPNPNHTC